MLKIRKININDIEKIASIHINSWQETYEKLLPKEYIKQYTIDRRIRMWNNIYSATVETVYIAEINNEVIGFINYGPYFENKTEEDIKELRSLYILPNLKSKGIGKKLTETVINEIKKSECKKILLYVLDKNIKAQQFYEKMGFRFTGREETEKFKNTTLTDLEMEINFTT